MTYTYSIIVVVSYYSKNNIIVYKICTIIKSEPIYNFLMDKTGKDDLEVIEKV